MNFWYLVVTATLPCPSPFGTRPGRDHWEETVRIPLDSMADNGASLRSFLSDKLVKASSASGIPLHYRSVRVFGPGTAMSLASGF